MPTFGRRTGTRALALALALARSRPRPPRRPVSPGAGDRRARAVPGQRGRRRPDPRLVGLRRLLDLRRQAERDLPQRGRRRDVGAAGPAAHRRVLRVAAGRPAGAAADLRRRRSEPPDTGNFYLSADAGKTWNPTGSVSPSCSPSFARDPAPRRSWRVRDEAPPQRGRRGHVDAADPPFTEPTRLTPGGAPGTVLAYGTTTVYRSTNDGGSWTSIASAPAGLPGNPRAARGPDRRERARRRRRERRRAGRSAAASSAARTADERGARTALSGLLRHGRGHRCRATPRWSSPARAPSRASSPAAGVFESHDGGVELRRPAPSRLGGAAARSLPGGPPPLRRHPDRRVRPGVPEDDAAAGAVEAAMARYEIVAERTGLTAVLRTALPTAGGLPPVVGSKPVDEPRRKSVPGRPLVPSRSAIH